MPATSASRYGEAVLTLTPTELTQLFTTVSRLFLSSPGATSCWYWPTPMLFGSTFTSSASGSCRRRAMEMAPRIVRSRSGNSSRATSLALYTLAPASLTITTGTCPQPQVSECAADEGLRLAPAVPLPTATADTFGVLDGERASICLRGLALAIRTEVDDVAAQVGARLAHDGELAAGADAGIDRRARTSLHTATRGAACAGSPRRPGWPPRRPPRAAPCAPRSRRSAGRTRGAPGAPRAS